MLAGRNIGMFVGIFTMTATWVGGGYINGKNNHDGGDVDGGGGGSDDGGEREREYVFQVKTVFTFSIIVCYLCPTSGAT